MHKKINEAGIVNGEVFVIKKMQLEGYADGNPFFKVELPENNANKITMDKYATGEIKAVEPSGPPIDKGAAKFEKQFEKKDSKMELHELTLRVETLEAEVNELKKNAIPF